ncbi:MAG: hypothetical protein JOY80_12490 [Candidatus Dormibacteraeota bacterium]|nr:hypothetical protein [Candidatus Dormibacteraeota bacterium]
MGRARWVKQLLFDLPRQLRLAYCLFRDDRVPAYIKGAFAAALGVIALPIVDIPASIPFLGELDVVALTLLAVRLFIAACPRYVVADQERLIRERHSRFDEDVRKGERVAIMIYRRLRPQDHDGLGVDGSAASQQAAAREAATV